MMGLLALKEWEDRERKPLPPKHKLSASQREFSTEIKFNCTSIMDF